MNFRMTAFLGTTAVAALVASTALAQTTAAPAPAPAAPTPAAAPFPAMSGSLAANTSPFTLDLGILGDKVMIGGVVSAYGQVQSNHVFGDSNSAIDVSNAQIFINKADGVFQYYIQAGIYSLPNLSTVPYRFSSRTADGGFLASAPSASFGNVPTAFVKIVPPGSPFSLQVGLLPTIIGDEYVFTFENLNVTRGLLWGAEPAVSRGVQLNYSSGPFSASVAFTDGFYSDRYNTISALGTWVIDGSNTLAVDASIPISKSTTYDETTNAPSPAYDNSKVYNIMYTHTMGQWTINPYLQYTALPEVVNGGVFYAGKEETWGAALLVNYAFDSKATFGGMSLSGFSVPFRVEYMHTNGSPSDDSPNLLYGAGSKAWSFTITPTYQYKNYYIRAEANFVTASDVDTADFAGYGSNDDKDNQFRGIIETGVLF